MKQSQKIKDKVRQTYGQIADRGALLPKESPSASCGCETPGLGSDQISTLLGYSSEDIETAPQGANLGLGCGSPKTIADIKKGETVVDLGSGGGFDCFIAAKQVGQKGRVIGVDMTPGMITRARKNKESALAGNVEFRLGEIEHLPVGDDTADLIISNCVINLSPEKRQVFKDAFRVLKTGGRLAISDILALKPLPEKIKEDLNLISACIGGAATIDETKQMLKDAAFKDITITPNPVNPELIETYLLGSGIGDYVAPADITAVK